MWVSGVCLASKVKKSMWGFRWCKMGSKEFHKLLEIKIE